MMGGCHVLAVLALCCLAACLAAPKAKRTSDLQPVCPQKGEERAYGLCERSAMPLIGEEDYRCVEMSPGQCPSWVARDWVQEGSVCFHPTVHPDLAFSCSSGKWTVTDATALRAASREKRFLGILIGFAICLFFCPPRIVAVVLPNKPPVITCPASISVTAPSGQSVVKVNWPSPTATDPDGRSPSPRQRNGPSNGSQLSEGTTFISYQVKDDGGLTDTCFFQVQVHVIRCHIVWAPVNGQHPVCSGALDPNQFGSQCEFSCDRGYVISGQRLLTCKQTGQWDHSPPTCSPVDCRQPGPVTGGSLDCPNGHSYPAWCGVMCNPGYRHKGAMYTSCAAQGHWTPEQGCEDKEPPKFPQGCPPDIQEFAAPLGAPVALTWHDPSTTDNSGEEVTLSSDPRSGSLFPPGFHTVRVTATDAAENSRSCRFQVYIQERNCPSLFVSDGHVTCNHGNLEGSECIVGCNTGYRVTGQSKLTCTGSRNWSASPPVCERVTCPLPPPSVKGGRLMCYGAPQYQSYCYLNCDKGFTAQAPDFVTCGVDGQWSHPVSCTDIEKPSLSCPDNVEVFAAPVGNDTVVGWNSPDVKDNSGEHVTVTSDVTSGASFPPGVTYVTYTATDTSGNSQTCRFSITVTTLSCGRPDLEDPARTRSLMLYHCPDGYVRGAECTVSCTNGYPLLGSSTITCSGDDEQSPPYMSWTYNGQKPTCRESNCPKLDPPQNGALSCLLGNFGWDCLMACNKSWDVPASFDGHLMCTNSDGFWRPASAPGCTVAYLPGRAKLPSELYYFTGACDTSLGLIRENFITALQKSTWRDACINVPTCAVENVQVTCGPAFRRRRSLEGDGWREGSGVLQSRHVRQAEGSLAVVISFDLLMDYVQNGTEEDTYKEYQAKAGQVWSALKSDAAQGVLNLGPLVPDVRYIAQPIVAFEGCPEGTVFVQRPGLTKPSCVGCSKGLYLKGTQCQECPVGHYSEVDNAVSCTVCPPGFSTLTTGSTDQDDCKKLCTAGHFSPTGFAPCLPCSPGQYQSRAQAVTCDLCPAGTWTVLAGAESEEDCVAADVSLSPNISLRASLTAQQSSMTLAAWMKLRQNSSLSVTLQFSNLSTKTLDLLVSSEGNNVTSKVSDASQSTFLLPENKWSRLVMVSREGGGSGGRMTVYVDDDHVLDTALPVLTTPVTAQLTFRLLQGAGVVSALHGEMRAWEEEEVVKAATGSSCAAAAANFSANLLTWSPLPPSVSLPSLCDAVDECQTSPCDSHGECENRVDGYLCHCQDGWSGHTCQTPPDACYKNRCQNGATCVPAEHNYTCECQEENSGDLCELGKVAGGWGEWGQWSRCSQTCRGQQQRQRRCNNPQPSHGGPDCHGAASETQECGAALCSVDGAWSAWSEWSDCSATCGGGESTRSRGCDSPSPQDGGATCSGPAKEKKSCATVVCPVHGGWGNWSTWSPCSVSCGDGTQSRERSCDSPVPANGGGPCHGSSNQTRMCNLAICPECSVLPEKKGTSFHCSKEKAHPYRKTCRVACSRGYSSPAAAVYTCGQETGYLWDFQRKDSHVDASRAIQYCTPEKTPTSASTTTTVPFPTAGCELKDHVGDHVRNNLLTSLPCVRQGTCRVHVRGSCDEAPVPSSPSPSSQRRQRRSAGSVRMTVDLKADLGRSVALADSDNSTIEKFVNTFQTVDQSAAMLAVNDTEQLFTVTLGDVTLTPDVSRASYTAVLGCSPGAYLSQDSGCVDCPPGFFEEGGKCRVCPEGQYQDQPASTSCKPCPPGKTWDTTGASDLSQCVYDRQTGPDETEPSKPPDSKEGVIIAATIGSIVGLVVVVATTAVVCRLKRPKRERAVTPLSPHGSTLCDDKRPGSRETLM
ncbi:uncharacterized protein LOC143301006 [Babylonia areolata]|uniref:uncharacterized protein LOC143301006 n=1 Tax=Babylonia areolata TaxID=304850 RepID=UPI003FD09623